MQSGRQVALVYDPQVYTPELWRMARFSSLSEVVKSGVSFQGPCEFSGVSPKCVCCRWSKNFPCRVNRGLTLKRVSSRHGLSVERNPWSSGFSLCLRPRPSRVRSLCVQRGLDTRREVLEVWLVTHP